MRAREVHWRGRRLLGDIGARRDPPFNDVSQPDVLHAAADVLAGAGFAVDIPRRRLCCGRPLFEQGWLEPARQALRETIDELASEIDEGIPIVGVEPTCTAMLRDELRALLPDSERAERLAANTVTLGELLTEVTPPAMHARPVLYHRHCHQHAVLDPERDVALLRAAGHDVTVLDSGCCGMAGPFGFERAHYEMSVALAERVLVPAVRAHPDATIVTDGFSCREQLRQVAGVTALHSAQLLAPGTSKDRRVPPGTRLAPPRDMTMLEPATERRRRLVRLAAFAAANFTLGSLVQTGAITRLPDPPIPGVDSYAVMTSRAAYPFGVPDAPIALAFHATVMALAGLAMHVRPQRRRLIDRLIAGGVIAGAVGVARYAAEMIRLRRACVYCIAAGATMLAMIPPALQNARASRA